MAEIIERGIIHFFSSSGVYLIALTGFWLLERKVRWWPHLHGWWALILPALLSFMVISRREIFDVAAGGLLVQSISDWISWIAGLGVSVWALYWLTPRLIHIRGTMRPLLWKDEVTDDD